MEPMYLDDVERHEDPGPRGEAIRGMEAAGLPVPGILRLYAYRSDATVHLGRYTQAVMRGPSELSAGLRELIAAFTSTRNDCVF